MPNFEHDTRTKYETKIDKTFEVLVGSAEKSLVTGLEKHLKGKKKNCAALTGNKAPGTKLCLTRSLLMAPSCAQFTFL